MLSSVVVRPEVRKSMFIVVGNGTGRLISVVRGGRKEEGEILPLPLNRSKAFSLDEACSASESEKAFERKRGR